MWWEQVLVGAIILTAVAWIIRKLMLTFRGHGSCGCGKSSCSKSACGAPGDAA